jgi:hypothetical protein
LLKNAKVQDRIQLLKDERAERAQVTADEVLANLLELWRESPEDMYIEDAEGRPRLKPFSELTRAQANTLHAVETTDTDTPTRNGMSSKRQLKVKHYSRDHALELTMRHLALFNDKLDLSTDIEYKIRVPGLDDVPRGDSADGDN